MEKEIWKAIPNYEGIYEASSLGRIRTCEGKTTFTKRHGVRHWKQRIIKPKGQTYATGYRVTLWKNGKPKDWLVARLVGMTFLGESNLTINHIDGNRFNNSVDNLEWCSLAENIRKGFETGLYHTQQKVKVIDKTTGEIKTFRSLTLACSYMQKGHGYITSCLQRGKTENQTYKWELLQGEQL